MPFEAQDKPALPLKIWWSCGHGAQRCCAPTWFLRAVGAV